MTITQLREDERPREKLMAHGAQSLSNAELLAILVGSGARGITAVELMSQVLDYYGGELSRLGAASIEELTGNDIDGHKRFMGMGEAKAITILAACELGRRRQKEERPERQRMLSSSDLYQYWRDEGVHLQPTEGLYLLCLNNALRVVKYERLTHGGLTTTLFDVRRIIKTAVLADATHIAVCHNHPSGSSKPSREDIAATKCLKDACDMMGIKLTDHIIITHHDYYSFADEGKL